MKFGHGLILRLIIARQKNVESMPSMLKKVELKIGNKWGATLCVASLFILRVHSWLGFHFQE
jgi:hypothetical protein